MRFRNKTVLITGASRGIGAQTARLFAREGARVVINYVRNRSAAEAVLAEVEAAGAEAHIVQADISDLAQVDAMFEGLREIVGEIDILVNNAARSADNYPRLQTVTPEIYDEVFQLNTRGLFFVTRQAVGMMRDNGRIINIASQAADIRSAGFSVYSASKAAVNAFTRVWATELGPRGITVNALECGAIATEMSERVDPAVIARVVSLTPLGRIGHPTDIASLVCFLASAEASWITGAEIPISGGFFG